MRVALRVGLVLLLVALAAVPAGAISRVGPAYVTIVPDGEMLYCEFGGRIEAVRYIGINTPWVDHPTYGRDRYNAVMREMNRRLVEGRWVYLYFEDQQRDPYGRLRAYVWRGDTFVNALLIHAGWAEATAQGRYVEYFRSLEQAARRDGRGLWRYPEVLAYYRPHPPASEENETVSPGSGGRVFSAPAPFLPAYTPSSPPNLGVPSGPTNPPPSLPTPPAPRTPSRTPAVPMPR